jgi:hypothetical protein
MKLASTLHLQKASLMIFASEFENATLSKTEQFSKALSLIFARADPEAEVTVLSWLQS